MAKERQKKAILYQKQGRRSHRGILVLLRKLTFSGGGNYEQELKNAVEHEGHR
jgi:hypothetical protein